MKICPNFGGRCFGLVLRELTDGSFKRMGTINIEIEPKRRVGLSGEDGCKMLSDYVETLPIRQVKII